MAKGFRTASGGVSAAGRKSAQSKGETMPGGGFPIRNKCLVGDTKICLLDGSTAELRDISPGSWAYGYDVNTKAVVPVQIEKVWLTIKDSPIVEIVLDDFSVIRCTRNHPFLLRDGTYAEAGNLRAGSSLMPLYRKMQKWGSGLYEYLFQPFYGFWELTHRMSYRGSVGALPARRTIIHHADGETANNSPDNLVAVNQSDHRKLHNLLDPEAHALANAVLFAAGAASWENPDRRAKHSEFMKRENEARKADGRIVDIGERIRAKKTGMRYKNSPPIDDAELERLYLGGVTQVELARKYSTTPATIRLRLKNLGISRRTTEEVSTGRRDIISGRYANHKVLFVSAGARGDVYDLCVPGTSNIALASGVFVHNSDLKNAKMSVGRAKNPAAARAWIDKSAKRVGGTPIGGKKK